MTADGKWCRLYPIHFRRLKGQFKRWQWIEYDWIAPGSDDRRRESRRVQVDTISSRRADAAGEACIVPGTDPHWLNGGSRGKGHEFYSRTSGRRTLRWKAKTLKQIAEERRTYEDAARQKSFLDPDVDLIALDPCPYAFHFDWTDANGKAHKATCDDWETAATFYRRQRTMLAREALASMGKTFGQEYPSKGMVFAMGTHSRRPNQWLLVEVLRLDRPGAIVLALSLGQHNAAPSFLGGRACGQNSPNAVQMRCRRLAS